MVLSCLSLSEIVIGPMKLQSYVNLRSTCKRLNTIHWSYFRNVVCRGKGLNGAWLKNWCMFWVLSFFKSIDHWVSRHAAFYNFRNVVCRGKGLNGAWLKNWCMFWVLSFFKSIDHWVSRHAAFYNFRNVVCRGKRLNGAWRNNSYMFWVFSTFVYLCTLYL